jgi:hypothetical protein
VHDGALLGCDVGLLDGALLGCYVGLLDGALSPALEHNS